MTLKHYWNYIKILPCNFFRVLNYTPCSVNVVSFSVKLNGALKAVSDISFISDKTMSRYSRESIKKKNEKIKELSHFVC